MIIQEKIQKKAEGFGKLAPVFLIIMIPNILMVEKNKPQTSIDIGRIKYEMET